MKAVGGADSGANGASPSRNRLIWLSPLIQRRRRRLLAAAEGISFRPANTFARPGLGLLCRFDD